ncbi:MAG: class I SAM-dependent methyltransferase [Cytophagaceae bacterium]|nr:class I SAM-dependent methyltransferase [Cytophagaceae bacterium]MDW8456917.1 class I SAM-dependent methyltransferase [Cytophagaceae bacterium]
MKQFLSSCPYCKSVNIIKYLTSADYRFSKENFDLYFCNECDLLFTNPRPNENDAILYYDSKNYVSHSDEAKGITNKLYVIVRKYTLNKKLSIINKLHPQKGKLLDIGCGSGHFLYACKKNGWNVAGIEVNDIARKNAEELVNENILKEINLVDKNHPFDIITLWHVLEHIYNLNEYLLKINNLLNHKGYLIIAVPNHQSYDCKKYKQYWAAYDVPRHVYHFSKKSLEYVLNDSGFKIVDILPMIFDSFYISMLSEKYKYNKINFLRAMMVGLISNIKALNTGDYSSLIYVCKKIS